MLDQHGALAIAELVFYIPVLPIAIYVGFKHGFGRSAGWFFLIILALLRIVGSSIEIYVETATDPDPKVIAIGVTLVSVGLSPLTLCALGILKRLYDEMHRKFIPSRVFWVLGAIPLIGLILSIVGGTDLSSSKPSDLSTGLTYLQVSSILFVVVVILEIGVTAAMSINLAQIPHSDRKLYYAVAISMPFLLIRVIYSILSAYNFANATSPFNSRTGNIYVQAFMAVLEEFVVVLLYLSAGISAPKQAKGDLAADKYMEQNNSNSNQQQQTWQQNQGYPLLQSYDQRSYPQQQTGSVAV